MRNLLTLFCVCVMGIQYSYQFMAEMNEIMNNCRRDGGYCINTIPPAPPRRRTQPRRRRPNARTRKGRRRQQQRGRKPDPKALGAAHSRLPAGAGARRARPAVAAAAPPPQAQYPQTPAYQPQYPAPAPTTSSPWDIFGLFGGGGGGGAAPAGQQNSMFGMLPFFGLTRKKRQAPAEPMEAAEMPRIRKGQPVMQFLNANCRKAEFDFGCQKQGGFCCLPPL